jgi:phosphoglycolate phosphatase
MIIQDFRHIIWDWNGTLFDDAWLCCDIMSRMLVARGLPVLTCERYQQVFDFPVIEYYRRVGFDFDKESFLELGSEFMKYYEARRHECSLQRGARTALERVSKAGCTQSVLSAYRHDSLQAALKHYGVDSFFSDCVGIDDHYAGGKTEQGLRWIAQSGLDKDRVLMVGDTTHDYEVAKAMGVACCLIPSGNHTAEKLKRCGVPVLESLEQIR